MRELLRVRPFIIDQKPRFSLRKIPLWGKQEIDANEIVFQWPTHDLLAGMPQDTKLASLTFKTAMGFYPVASIQVKLSNDSSSNVYEKQGVQFDHL